MLVKTTHLRIKRDAMTEIYVDVADYEVAILRKIHGKENLYLLDEPNVIEVNENDEYQRLCNKYGEASVVAGLGETAEGLMEEICLKAKADEQVDSEDAPSARRGRPAKAE